MPYVDGLCGCVLYCILMDCGCGLCCIRMDKILPCLILQYKILPRSWLRSWQENTDLNFDKILPRSSQDLLETRSCQGCAKIWQDQADGQWLYRCSDGLWLWAKLYTMICGYMDYAVCWCTVSGCGLFCMLMDCCSQAMLCADGQWLWANCCIQMHCS